VNREIETEVAEIIIEYPRRDSFPVVNPQSKEVVAEAEPPADDVCIYVPCEEPEKPVESSEKQLPRSNWEKTAPILLFIMIVLFLAWLFKDLVDAFFITFRWR
jgi:hypothetical protein